MLRMMFPTVKCRSFEGEDSMAKKHALFLFLFHLHAKGEKKSALAELAACQAVVNGSG